MTACSRPRMCCLPAEWENFKLHYRYRNTTYHITVSQTRGATTAARIVVDGVEQPDGTISMVDDRVEHAVEVSVNRAQS